MSANGCPPSIGALTLRANFPDRAGIPIWIRRAPHHPTQRMWMAELLSGARTGGFEFNGPHAGPLFYRHLRAPTDRIGKHRKLWNGKHYGKHINRTS